MCESRRPTEGADSAPIEHPGQEAVDGSDHALRSTPAPESHDSAETRHVERGAGEPDLADMVADYLVATSMLDPEVRAVIVDGSWELDTQCGACSLPAVDDGYCVGHARLFEYRVTDENHWAANE